LYYFFYLNENQLPRVNFERFLIAVTKVRSTENEKPTSTESRDTKDFIFLNAERRKVKILFSEIVYIESQQEYIKIVTTKREYISKMSTHEIEDLLPANLFKRIHRSFIISLSKIESYTAEMIDVNGVSLPIGRGYRDVIENL
jgi:two-component system LytT family response regulator